MSRVSLYQVSMNYKYVSTDEINIKFIVEAWSVFSFMCDYLQFKDNEKFE